MIKARLAISALLLGIASPALAGDQDFVLVNNTGYTISEIYVAPTRSSDWEEDVMGRDVLADGERVNIRFSRDEDTCLWDIKAVYADQDTAEWQSFNLCEVSVIAVSYDAETGTTSAEYE
jgi:hypothetical protein